MLSAGQSPEIFVGCTSSPKIIAQHLIPRCHSGALDFPSEGKMVTGLAGTGSHIQPVCLTHLKQSDSKVIRTSLTENCRIWDQKRFKLGLGGVMGESGPGKS